VSFAVAAVPPTARGPVPPPCPSRAQRCFAVRTGAEEPWEAAPRAGPWDAACLWQV